MENHTPKPNEEKKTFKVTKSVRLNEGPQTGTVVLVEFRHDPYEYTDLYISVDGWEFSGEQGNKELGQLKYGVSTNFSINSQLIALMSVFGKEAKENDEFTEDDVRNVFLNKKVKFVVFDKSGKDKTGKAATFSNIVQGSLKVI